MATKTIRVALAVATCLWLGSSAADEFALQKVEFAKYYHAITGKDAPEGTVRFAIDSKVSKSGRDAYSIVTGSGRAGRPRPADTARPEAAPYQCVTITGSNLRSVWYGLYDLLERRGGCHWFWDGDVVPKKDSIDLSGLDIHEEAHFEYRAIRYFAHRGLTRFQAEHWGPDDWKREIDWLLKKRLNVLMLRIGQDDLFQRAFPEACKYPDPAKRLPGAGSSYNDRTLFWSLQYQRLDAIEKIRNPDFTKTLFENAVNHYCLSHQYEVVRHVVVPTVKAMAERLAKAVESGDRKAAAFTAKPDYAKVRGAAKAKPLESLKPTLPRRGAPPPPGTVMRMNFSRVDHVDGVEHNTVWAPTRLKTIACASAVVRHECAGQKLPRSEGQAFRLLLPVSAGKYCVFCIGLL